MATEAQRQLSDGVDRLLAELMTKGRPVYDEDGAVKYHVKASAADITAALKRLQQCGVSAVPTDENPAGDLYEAARSELGLKLAGGPPAVDTEADDAATA